MSTTIYWSVCSSLKYSTHNEELRLRDVKIQSDKQSFLYFCITLIKNNINQNLSLCVTTKHVKSLRAHLRVIALGNSAPFQEMMQRWRAVGDTVSDLTHPRFELLTSRSRDNRVTARPTGLATILR